MTEKALQRKVINKLKSEWDALAINTSPGQWDRVGCADIVACVMSEFVAIELKNPGMKNPLKGLSHAQCLFLNNVVDAGGIAIVANSWEDVNNLLRVGIVERRDGVLYMENGVATWGRVAGSAAHTSPSKTKPGVRLSRVSTNPPT